jgi:hypothetical protein
MIHTHRLWEKGVWIPADRHGRTTRVDEMSLGAHSPAFEPDGTHQLHRLVASTVVVGGERVGGWAALHHLPLCTVHQAQANRSTAIGEVVSSYV